MEQLDPGHDFYVYRSLPKKSSAINILCFGVIKHTQRSTFPARRVQEDLRKFRGIGKPVLLITNADMTQQGKGIIASSDLNVFWQIWRNETDNLELQATLMDLIR